MAKRFKVADRFVVRAPLLSFGELERFGNDAQSTRAAMLALWQRPEVQEAVYIASPSLAKTAAEWVANPETPDGAATERSLLRYMLRMAYRCTPFGLFSSVSPGHFAAAAEFRIGARVAARQQTRIDNDYLASICDQLAAAPELAAELRYVPNSSLYPLANKLRYAESRRGSGGRSYTLVAVEPSDYLAAVLARAENGATKPELIEVLCADPEITAEEAHAFLDQVIEAQVVVPTLAPPVTGNEPLVNVIDVLAQTTAGRPRAQALTVARDALRAIDSEPMGKPADRYLDVLRTLRSAMPEAGREDRMLQVDLYRPGSVELPLGARRMFEDAAAVMMRFGTVGKSDQLEKFKSAFSARYESAEVPLAEALDDDLGIGFGEAEVGSSPLLAGLALGGNANAAPRHVEDRRGAYLQRRLADLPQFAPELELTDADMTAIETKVEASPRILSMMCTLGGNRADLDAGKAQISVHSVDASSAARLLGRFCHGSPDVNAMAREAIAIEEAAEPNAVFAEIVHLPEGRLGNILARPVLRPYEIPYLGVSGAPRDHQLPLTDLLVSVRGGRIVLRSQRLGREVIPRLTTAHNFTSRSLGIYRFLCLLPGQDALQLYWSWGSQQNRPYLPRVRYKNLVFERATWNLIERDIEPIAKSLTGSKAAKTPAQLAALRAAAWDAVQALRTRLHLPRWVVLADSDNELPIDLDNELGVDNFAHLIRARTSATLHELYPVVDNLIAQGEDGAYTNEVLVSFRAEGVEPSKRPVLAPRATNVPRRLAAGSEWLYVKIYSGASTGDNLVRELIGPITAELNAAGAIDHWFFIRYADPDPHLRLRLHGDPARLLEQALPALARAVGPFVDKRQVWKWQIDTYEREVERYGGPEGIELAERWFHADSELATRLAAAVTGDEAADLMWRFVYWAMDQTLVDFGFSLEQKFQLVSEARESYGREFGANSEMQKALGERHRKAQAQLVPRYAELTDEVATAVRDALAARSAVHVSLAARYRELEAAGALTGTVTSIVQSLLHMHCNRTLVTNQRAQEFVLFDYLRRAYDAQRARARSKPAGE